MDSKIIKNEVTKTFKKITKVKPTDTNEMQSQSIFEMSALNLS